MPLYDDFVREIRIKNRASRTIYTLEQVLKKAEESLDKPLEDATFDELMTYIEGQKKIFSKNTVSLSIHKFVQFYKFCFETTEDMLYKIFYNQFHKRQQHQLSGLPPAQREHAKANVRLPAGIALRDGVSLRFKVTWDLKWFLVLFNRPNNSY